MKTMFCVRHSLYLKLCKYLLGLKKQHCYGELRTYPDSITIKVRLVSEKVLNVCTREINILYLGKKKEGVINTE